MGLKREAVMTSWFSLIIEMDRIGHGAVGFFSDQKHVQSN